MLISTKLKIAAAIILLGGIPIGTGAYLLASSADHSVVAPSSVVAPAVTIAKPTLDPRVVPFVTDSTDIIIAIDLNKIDLDALVADMHQEMAQSHMDAPATARLNATIQMGLMVGKKWIAGFKQAGGSSVFLLSRSDALTVNNGPKTAGLNLAATLICPADSVAMAPTLAKYMTFSGIAPPKVIGDTVVNQIGGAELPEAGDWSGLQSELAAGLAAAGDAPIRAAINPAKLKDILPKLMASGQVTAKFTGHEWDDVEYASINLVLPPAESPSFLVITHHKDAAAAEKAKVESIDRINHAMAITGAYTPLNASMKKFVQSEKFTVKDNDVIATMDLHAYWDLIFAAMQMGNQPAGSQPAVHAKLQ